MTNANISNIACAEAHRLRQHIRNLEARLSAIPRNSEVPAFGHVCDYIAQAMTELANAASMLDAVYLCYNTDEEA